MERQVLDGLAQLGQLAHELCSQHFVSNTADCHDLGHESGLGQVEGAVLIAGH